MGDSEGNQRRTVLYRGTYEMKTFIKRFQVRSILWLLRRLKYEPGAIIKDAGGRVYIIDCNGSRRRVYDRG